MFGSSKQPAHAEGVPNRAKVLRILGAVNEKERAEIDKLLSQQQRNPEVFRGKGHDAEEGYSDDCHCDVQVQTAAFPQLPKSRQPSLQILKLCRWSSIDISNSIEVHGRHSKVLNFGKPMMKSTSRVTPSNKTEGSHQNRADKTFPLPPPAPATVLERYHHFPSPLICANSEDETQTGHPLPLPSIKSSPQQQTKSCTVKEMISVNPSRPRELTLQDGTESYFSVNNCFLLDKSPLNSPQNLNLSPFCASPSEKQSRKSDCLFSKPPQQLPAPPQSPTSKIFCPENWRTGGLLGRGTFGNVYEGWNLDDGSFFAVKVSRSGDVSPEIQQEVNLLKKLDHPNIVRYYGSSIENGRICIFLELVRMGPLTSIIKKYKRLEDHTIRSYTRQILLGLQYLHAKKTMHRDIKCANILVDVNGQVKLSDFGMAKQIGEVLASSLAGTPLFMAPEVVTAHGNRYSFSADIWSLGCTVLEMADGKPPWSDLKGFGFLFKLKNAELPPLPEHLSPEGKDFIRSCLRFNPEDRPTALELLQHPFVA